jgi:hypothetical protein
MPRRRPAHPSNEPRRHGDAVGFGAGLISPATNIYDEPKDGPKT